MPKITDPDHLPFLMNFLPSPFLPCFLSLGRDAININSWSQLIEALKSNPSNPVTPAGSLWPRS